MTKPIDITGQRFGLLTVIERAPFNTKQGGTMWVCACDCGGEKTAWAANITGGKTQSCGCIRRKQLALRNSATKTTHGMTGSAEYNIWTGLIDRCKNPKSKDFKNYQGRGITVCDRWLLFVNFYADMGPRPSPKHSIDRKDNDAGYSPENCRWATMKEQSNNKRDTVRIEWNGETKSLSDWAIECGIKSGTLYSRHRKGLTGGALFSHTAPKFS